MHKRVEMLLNLCARRFVCSNFGGKRGVAPATNNQASTIKLPPVLIAFVGRTWVGEKLFINWLCGDDLAPRWRDAARQPVRTKLRTDFGQPGIGGQYQS